MDMTQLFGHTSKLLSRKLWEPSIHAAIFFNQNRRETFKQYRIKGLYAIQSIKETNELNKT